MKTKIRRFFFLLLLFQMFCFFLISCGSPKQDDTDRVEAISYDQQLKILLSLTPVKIQIIDFVYVRPENGGTRVYKTFTETNDLQAVLDALKSANLQTIDNQAPQGGWTVLLRIWRTEAAGEVAEPLLLSTGGDTTVHVGGYAYAAENEGYYTDLIALYEVSAAEEMPYTV